MKSMCIYHIHNFSFCVYKTIPHQVQTKNYCLLCKKSWTQDYDNTIHKTMITLLDHDAFRRINQREIKQYKSTIMIHCICAHWTHVTTQNFKKGFYISRLRWSRRKQTIQTRIPFIVVASLHNNPIKRSNLCCLKNKLF